MNELDKLRGMLLDSGTEFLDHSSDLTVGYYTDPHSVTESMDGTLIVTGLTAEQVMLALRPRTCRKLPSSGETRCFVSRYGCEREFGYWKCSNCGAECFEGAKYCMSCRAKAVSE